MRVYTENTNAHACSGLVDKTNDTYYCCPARTLIGNIYWSRLLAEFVRAPWLFPRVHAKVIKTLMVDLTMTPAPSTSLTRNSSVAIMAKFFNLFIYCNWSLGADQIKVEHLDRAYRRARMAFRGALRSVGHLLKSRLNANRGSRTTCFWNNARAHAKKTHSWHLLDWSQIFNTRKLEI